MEESQQFLRSVLDSITDHIVVINNAGIIISANKSWCSFGGDNACEAGENWDDLNYLEECDKAAAMGEEFGFKAGEGIRKVINKENTDFYLEYPCHSPEVKRWFMMRVTPFKLENIDYLVISHRDITERKLAEEEIRQLARIDGLTGIPNRRTFDEFISNEINRCARLNKPICLAIIDIDHFKLLNDTYGHQSGDDCLVRIGQLLKTFSNRPSDLCARYGVEELALIWGDLSLNEARQLSNKFLSKVRDLNIPNKMSPTNGYLTVSIGLAELLPSQGSKDSELIFKADSMLYKAKDGGRNKVEC
jgi:diguanylate cyclase (GGDEF)-like protein